MVLPDKVPDRVLTIKLTVYATTSVLLTTELTEWYAATRALTITLTPPFIWRPNSNYISFLVPLFLLSCALPTPSPRTDIICLLLLLLPGHDHPPGIPALSGTIWRCVG
eukprot:3824982-Rhodomonas_salina.8